MDKKTLRKECDEFIKPLVANYRMPLTLAETELLHNVWAEAGRRARQDCARICNGFDACDPGYIADAILESIPKEE